MQTKYRQPAAVAGNKLKQHGKDANHRVSIIANQRPDANKHLLSFAFPAHFPTFAMSHNPLAAKRMATNKTTHQQS
jgi:hypothetical protein